MAVNVNLELTDLCNLRCGMCSQSLREDPHGSASGGPLPSGGIPQAHFMDWPTWRAVLGGLADMSEPVHLCPHWLGEPTLHPHFEPMLEYAFARNTGNRLFRTFKLHTNGVRLDGDRSRLLLRLARYPGQADDTFTTIHLSLDAWSRAVFLRVKGADLLPLVESNVRRFLRFRRDARQVWPRVHLAFVVQPENADEASDFVSGWGGLLDELGQTWDLCSEWPPHDHDAIYIRRLNCREQRAADTLHARVCQSLGLASTSRVAESF